MFNLEGQPVQVAQGNPVRVRIPLEGPWEGALIARCCSSTGGFLRPGAGHFGTTAR
jgi:hypothetical protein